MEDNPEQPEGEAPEPREETPQEPREAEGGIGEELPERFYEPFRHSLQEIVESAVHEAVELKRKGRDWKQALDAELDRVRLEVRRAYQSARAGLRPIDVKRLKKELQGRTNVLMTRVRDRDLKRVDLLVESGLFESRSQAAAFLIHAGLEARRDLVGKVEDTAQRIAELKDRLRDELAAEE